MSGKDGAKRTQFTPIIIDSLVTCLKRPSKLVNFRAGLYADASPSAIRPCRTGAAVTVRADRRLAGPRLISEVSATTTLVAYRWHVKRTRPGIWCSNGRVQVDALKQIDL